MLASTSAASPTADAPSPLNLLLNITHFTPFYLPSLALLSLETTITTVASVETPSPHSLAFSASPLGRVLGLKRDMEIGVRGIDNMWGD